MSAATDIDILTKDFSANPEAVFVQLEHRYIEERRWEDLLDVYETRRARFSESSAFWKWVADRLEAAVHCIKDSSARIETHLSIAALAEQTGQAERAVEHYGYAHRYT